MEDPCEYIDNVLSQDNIDPSIDCFNKILNEKRRAIKIKLHNTQLNSTWLEKCRVYASAKWDKDNQRISEFEDIATSFKKHTRNLEKILWKTNERDNANLLKILKKKNCRIDVLTSELFPWHKSSKNFLFFEEFDDIGFRLFLHSAAREKILLKNEIAFLKDTLTSVKDQAGTSKILKDVNNEDEKKLFSEAQKCRVLFSQLIVEAHNVKILCEYWSNLLLLRSEKIKRLTEIKEILTSINDTNDEQELMKFVRVHSVKSDNYIDKMLCRIYNACNNVDSETTSRRVVSDFRGQLTAFKDAFSKLCEKMPLKSELNERNCQLAELEDQYVQLTEKPKAFNQQPILSKNFFRVNADTKLVQAELEKLMKKHEDEVKIVVMHKETSTDPEREPETQKVNDELMSDTNKVNNEEEKECLTTGEEHEEKRRISEEDHEKQKEEYEARRNENRQKIMKLKTTIKDQSDKVWDMLRENFKLKKENQRLEREIEMNKEILKDIKLQCSIDAMIVRKKIMLEKKKRLNNVLNHEFTSDKMLLYTNMQDVYNTQVAIEAGNKYYNYLLEKVS